jgi:hypothetical protein
VRQRLARRLPPHLLVRIVGVACPRGASALLAAGELAASALSGRPSPEARWEALLDAAAAPEGTATARLVERLTAGETGEDVAAALLQAARNGAHHALVAALEDREVVQNAPNGRGAAGAGGEQQPEAARRRQASRSAEAPLDLRSPVAESEKAPRPMFVNNAGLVLTAPYLPQLFRTVELLVDRPEGGQSWRDTEAAARAVHLLQYLVDGRTDAPEPLLPLNKLLCGIDPSWPALAGIEMTEIERATCDSLLAAVIAHWEMMRGSSVAALQETFLQREGRLTRTEAGWTLEVQRKVLDVLVDSVPWSFSFILQPWMTEPLSVTW